jgi:hypothetical protein
MAPIIERPGRVFLKKNNKFIVDSTDIHWGANSVSVHIHLKRIPILIQHFKLNTNPDSNRNSDLNWIQGLMSKHSKNKQLR